MPASPQPSQRWGHNPDWPRAHPLPTLHAWSVQTVLGDAGGQDGNGRDLAWHPWRERVRRHAGEPGRARPGAGRAQLRLRLRLRDRGRAVRRGARDGYRQLRAGAGQLLWPVRHPACPWAGAGPRHGGAGADIGYHRLIRTGWQDLRLSVRRQRAGALQHRSIRQPRHPRRQVRIGAVRGERRLSHRQRSRSVSYGCAPGMWSR